MYGCTEAQMREAVESSPSFRFSGPAMVVASMMSDAQEMMAYEQPDFQHNRRSASTAEPCKICFNDLHYGPGDSIMGMMSRLYTDIQEMISLNCTEDQVVDFVVQEYGLTISDAQEVIADVIYEEERMVLATGYN
jgi:hypothetical protein